MLNAKGLLAKIIDAYAAGKKPDNPALDEAIRNARFILRMKYQLNDYESTLLEQLQQKGLTGEVQDA